MKKYHRRQRHLLLYRPHHQQERLQRRRLLQQQQQSHQVMQKSNCVLKPAIYEIQMIVLPSITVFLTTITTWHCGKLAMPVCISIRNQWRATMRNWLIVHRKYII